jgi:hypothetical protein
MNKNSISLLIALATLALMLALYVAWFYGVSQVSASIRATEEKIVLARQESLQNIKTKEALLALSSNADMIRGFFVEKESLVSFLEALSKTGTLLGSTLEVVSVSDSKDANGNPRIVVALKIQGSFDVVLRTVGALEQGPYDSKVENLHLEARQLDVLGEPWTASVTLSVGARATE